MNDEQKNDDHADEQKREPMMLIVKSFGIGIATADAALRGVGLTFRREEQ
jgi:hypothetical protein